MSSIGLQRMMERLEAEKQAQSAQELVIDQSNKVQFPGFPYSFEAAAKKIIVSIDVFKSGYECRICKGKGRLETLCFCESGNRPGFKYSEEQIKTLLETLGDVIAQGRAEEICPVCKGEYKALRQSSPCTECSGRGAILVLPETAKNLPTTGVVVSIGPMVKLRPDGATKHGYKIGDRVLFGPYAGSMIPTKAGILFKILDANAIWAKVEGAEDLGRFDFILQANE